MRHLNRCLAFGLPLHQALDVPVGLLQGAVGGTPSGNWLSGEAYRADEACKKVAAEFAKTYSLDAWGQTHPWANLFNNDGLPALPFRTDAW